MTEPPQPLSADPAVPLVVDLDGTLLLTDTLVESFNAAAFHSPLQALGSLGSLAQGRAAFKRRLAGVNLPNAGLLPLRLDLVAMLQAERGRGRPLYLVSAADQGLVRQVADAVGLFDGAIGSDGVRNLKGPAKRDYLVERFPGGFLYAGDAAADVPVFEAAKGAILCDAASRTEAAVTRSNTPVEARFRSAPANLRTWARAFRIHQWSKNLLVFVPLFVGHAFGEPTSVVKSCLAFVITSVLISATYMLNDLADAEADRAHPTKRRRPFASGALPIALGLVLAPLMIAAALAAAVMLSVNFALLLAAYLVLTVAYSFSLKRIPLIDVFVIGVLFTLRVAMGAAVLDLPQSPWLLSFSLAFFLSLALAKRHSDVMAASEGGADILVGRGYRSGDWPLTLSFGVGACMMSLIIMLLYLANDAVPSGFYGQVGWLYGIPTLMAIWTMRIWLLSHRTILNDDPVIFALRDRVSLVLGVGVLAIFLLALQS